jgi:putative phage-type endonuclease
MREENKLQAGDAFGHWMNLRSGKLTASRMAAAMSFLKTGKESSERRKLKIEILAERLTGDIVPKFTNDAMQWGIDKEPEAKAAFEAKTGMIVTDVGFVDHPTIEHCGASPDGLVSDGSLIEIKCPTTGRHLEYLLAGVVPEEYRPQMTLQSACMGKPVWFVSYDPRLPEKQSLFIRKFEPTEKEIKEVEEAAVQFLSEVDEMFDLITIGEK